MLIIRISIYVKILTLFELFIENFDFFPMNNEKICTLDQKV